MYNVLEQRIKDSKCYEEMERGIKGIIEELRDLELEDIGEYLMDVLDISRKQYRSTVGWQTEYYELCLSWGGPGVWLRTDGKVIGAWWGDYLQVKINDKKVLETLSEIERYLDETLQ